MKKTFLLLLLSSVIASADPQLSSWYTAGSSKYARLVETDAELLAGSSKTTWTRTSGPNTISQTLPVYSGPQEISCSASWIYVKTPNLGPYIMGPWYDNAAKSALFVNIPKNQNIIFRIPRSSSLGAIPTTKTSTLGLNVGGVMQDAVGFYADGVALFDPMDGYSYSGGTETSPGTGQWHRDAYVNEAITFDKGFSHQQNTGKYHNHADPLALRYLLGDNVTFNNTSKVYAEGNTAAPTKHSPILAWMLDGLPLYGPYGYSSPMDSTSGVRRMVGGFVLRNGLTTGVDNLTTAGRTLPTWALRNNGNVSATGPTVSTTYPLGRYIEDNAYLGDLIKTGTTKYAQGTDFDLNEYNVRYCVTPEFPSGTWAYFLNVTSAGSPQFPYMINRYFYGTPTGGSITSVAETVTNQFTGGVGLAEAASVSNVNTANGEVTLTWTSLEGGSYKVEASNDLNTWSTLFPYKTATANSAITSLVESNATGAGRRFYRLTRSALAAYDGGTGYTSAAPTAATSAASVVGSSSATLNGTVNGNGLSTVVTFEYGLTNSYGGSLAASQSPLTGSSSTSVSLSLVGFSASTTYHFRVKAVNSFGTTYGNDTTFTTTAVGAATAPTVVTSAATAIATSTATLNGTVNANATSTTTSFEYGQTASYGSSVTATPTTVTGSTTNSIAASLTGLTSGTTYYFRAKGVNSGGTSYGSNQTFTTTAVSAEGVASIAPNSGARGATVVTTITLNSGYSMAPPPSTVAPTSVNLTKSGAATIGASTYSRNSTTGVVTATFIIPAGATVGAYTVNATFGPNTWSLTNGFTVN